MAKITAYPVKAKRLEEQLEGWAAHRDENVVKYRNHQFRSIFTGTSTPPYHKHWIEAFDDSLEAFISDD